MLMFIFVVLQHRKRRKDNSLSDKIVTQKLRHSTQIFPIYRHYHHPQLTSICLIQICGHIHLTTSQMSIQNPVKAQMEVPKPPQASEMPLIGSHREPEVLRQKPLMFLPPWFFRTIPRLMHRLISQHMKNWLILRLLSTQKSTISLGRMIKTSTIMVLTTSPPQDIFPWTLHPQGPTVPPNKHTQPFCPPQVQKIPTIPGFPGLTGPSPALVPSPYQVPTKVPSTAPEKQNFRSLSEIRNLQNYPSPDDPQVRPDEFPEPRPHVAQQKV